MLKIYFSSVLIWWLILAAVVEVLYSCFENNGWVSNERIFAFTNPFVWMVSLIPVFRLLILASLIYMAIFKEEDNKE